MKAKENFQNNLKELILLNHQDITSFSAAIGISRRSVSNWFSSRSPKLESLIKVADYFDCSIDYLLGNTESKTFNRSENPVDFFTRYTFLKQKNDFTDFQIAKICQISTSTIVKWKDGVTPEFEILVKLSRLFECSFEYLIGRSESD